MMTLNPIKQGCKASDIRFSQVQNPFGLVPVPNLHAFVREAAEKVSRDYFVTVGPATRDLLGMLDSSEFLMTGQSVCIARDVRPVSLSEFFDDEIDDIRVFTEEQLWEEARFELTDYLLKGDAAYLDRMVQYIILDYALWQLNGAFCNDADDARFWTVLEGNLVSDL